MSNCQIRNAAQHNCSSDPGGWLNNFPVVFLSLFLSVSPAPPSSTEQPEGIGTDCTLVPVGVVLGLARPDPCCSSGACHLLCCCPPVGSKSHIPSKVSLHLADVFRTRASLLLQTVSGISASSIVCFCVVLLVYIKNKKRGGGVVFMHQHSQRLLAPPHKARLRTCVS